jgi:ribonuclease HII
MLKKYLYKNVIEAGIDEAGRGCLAGPVFASAVILPQHFEFSLLNDSKKLKENDRLLCREFIEKHALAFSISSIDNKVIDKINILQASFKAMHKAIDQLAIRPELLLIDGNRFKPYFMIGHECVIKGDGKIMSIAAASILAKTYRDDYMHKIHKQFPVYNWLQNKGYPTLAHRSKVLEIGFSKYHRQTFAVQVGEKEL